MKMSKLELYVENRIFYETWLKDCENLTMEQ